ncbi:MAG: two-component system sensor histidine kinase RppB [Pseudanabaenaceae cyanobacterium bins.68]|nr:two-component system sensor histidine kinase RppB [Pseudanabaenaceae cyanobacterium bins.68]
MNGLFRRSRIRLALWYSLVMGSILSLSGFAVYRSILHSNWIAMEREIESIAGTLHDSLEPMLPASGDASLVLQRIFPELCLSDRSCNYAPTLIQRHTVGISDRSIYYIRLYDHRGKLLAFSPSQPLSIPETVNSSQWQTFFNGNGTRYLQFTTILHSAYAKADQSVDHPSWGYLQIGRTLAALDGEINRIQWILVIGFPIVLLLVGCSSWWLSGLAMQPIYKSYEQQQQFTANAAHELRSPLASLLATVEAVTHIQDRENLPNMLSTIERQGRRLSRLIDDLLLLSSLEQNKADLQFQPCCLNDLIGDLAEEFLELAATEGIHLSYQIPDFEIYVWGNESQLYRLVANLIANAIQYTASGGDVAVSLTSRDHTAVISVKDTGIGIAESEQPRIFERFYRVDSDRSRKTGGTGLGLAIAMAIVLHHQGDLTVKSEFSQGSLFMIHLPCHQVVAGSVVSHYET